jgi:acetyl esterase/lipase
MRTILALIAALAAGLIARAHAERPNFNDLHFTWIAIPAQPGAIPLYPGVAPGSEHATQQERWGFFYDGRMVHNVTRPTLMPFLPPPGKATGAAMIVAPGGAFMTLSMDDEGYKVARVLAAHGIAAFVLKYRLDPTPNDDEGLKRALAARVGAAARAGVEHAPPIISQPAIDDGLQAVRLVRTRAGAFHIDPHRIGFIGFSAGAMTALQVALTNDDSARPDVVGMIYGPMIPVTVPPHAPPLFAALAIDDPLMARGGFGLVTGWHDAGHPAELHLFDSGSHGFGLGAPGTTASHWSDEFLWFLQEQHFLTK